ncbi:MAG TPA: circularly permuted type 2 ATP-grasp protein [Leptospiraceae bacterium]|nr:circularly permuted type 2 ATP-grasp protein [Leptospiraceae bacterium]HNB96894.1 circularly permuted type 2 ATP-grasp protein [Leptospiraceae bacterium]HNE06843.1 circularly permuted type 2 ATP-grasp protein [Leptospiraceae bacterium]HNG98860.1 circularly permuted type 2 ATP-grasp protein [Leptospiraceae bacterium]HNI86504.1 circularly permuted type 2 ATP-grasp protein [Leptospiraceae bacterium]
MTSEQSNSFSVRTNQSKESFSEIKPKNSNGKYRPEYSEILPMLESQSVDRLRSINKRIEFVLKEQGITFGESRRGNYVERPWYLDLIPHIVNESEFSLVERGVKQRLLALNKFLLDIYSSRKILIDKVIPKEVILADPNYLRDCQSVKVPHDVYLHIGAFDIARSSDGSFQVIDDNVTIPSGISYAMTNRQVLRQQFPNIFEKASIKQIWDTTPVMLSILKECAPTQDNNPMVVLLSPGIYNEAYSEHELLANKMGIPLVLPKDLIVKDNHVFMKTVYGLSRVDVIYRRIQDYYIDPVSFYQDSVLGVPGLFSCVRYGNVTVANAIGSGVASSKSLLPFTDAIIRYYLSEEPILKSVPTALLSDPKFVEFVFSNIDDFVIKPKQGTGGLGILIGRESTRAQIEDMKQKVLKNPFEYVAQELIPLSTAKVFTPDGNFKERYVETRFYTFLGNSFHLSNCALTRVSKEESSLMVCNAMGGGSKDTWIMGKNDVIHRRSEILFPNRITRSLILSRVAESLFWLGRYINRGFTTANVLQVAYSSEIDILLGSDDPSYTSLIKTLSRLTGSPVKKLFKSSEPWHVSFFKHAVADSRNPYSVKSNMNYAMNNAREIQNYLSNDMWVSLRKLLEYLSELPGVEDSVNQNMTVDHLSEWLVGVVHYSQSFYGASLDTFSRQDILQFIQLGRYIEHCSYIITVIKSTLQFLVKATQSDTDMPNLQPFIIVILKILNSYEAYQWNYQSIFDPYLAYKMMITDKGFNNSLVSSLDKIKSILNAIGTDSGLTMHDEETPEYICDVLISRAFSFDLKDNLGKPSVNPPKIKKQDQFLYAKDEVKPGYWASHLKAGIELLGNKIMDRYSNISSPTPFTVQL